MLCPLQGAQEEEQRLHQELGAERVERKRLEVSRQAAGIRASRPMLQLGCRSCALLPSHSLRRLLCFIHADNHSMRPPAALLFLPLLQAQLIMLQQQLEEGAATLAERERQLGELARQSVQRDAAAQQAQRVQLQVGMACR